jgi:hypothetical protein
MNYQGVVNRMRLISVSNDINPFSTGQGRLLFALKLSAINLSSGVNAILEEDTGSLATAAATSLGLALDFNAKARFSFLMPLFYSLQMASESNDQFVCQLF